MKKSVIALTYGGFSFVIVLAVGKNVIASLVCFAVLFVFAMIMLAILESLRPKEDSVLAFSPEKKQVDMDTLISSCRVALKKIERYKDDIESEAIVRQIDSIVSDANKIIDKAKDEQLNRVRNFFDYYIPETCNILQKYYNIQKSGAIDAAFQVKAEKFLAVVNDGLGKQLENMIQNDMAMAEIDMDVMQTTLKAEGLLDDGLGIGK